MNNSHMHTNHSPLMNTKSYNLVPGLCKWVTSSIPLPLLLSSPAGRRNEVVLSAVEECYFGQQVLQGLYWPWVSVDHCGLGHHQGAPVSCDFKLICTTALKASTCASRCAWKYSDIKWRDAIYLPFHQANVLDFKDLIQSIVTKGLNETGTYSPRWVKADLVKEKLKKPEATWGLRVSLRFNLDSKCYAYDWLQTSFFFLFWLTYCQHMCWNQTEMQIFLFCNLPSISLLPTCSRLCLLSSVTSPSPALVLSFVLCLSLVSFLSLTVLQSIYNCYVLLYRTHWGRVRKLCSSEKCVMSFYFQHDTQTEVQTNLLSAKTVNCC